MAAYSPGGFHSTGFPRGVWLPRTPPITHCAGAMPSALHGLLYHSQHAKTERKSLRVREVKLPAIKCSYSPTQGWETPDSALATLSFPKAERPCQIKAQA